MHETGHTRVCKDLTKRAKLDCLCAKDYDCIADTAHEHTDTHKAPVNKVHSYVWR